MSEKSHVSIHYQPNGTIQAEMYPGTVNFTYWLAKEIDSGRWRSTVEGIWLGCMVTPEEADRVQVLLRI